MPSLNTGNAILSNAIAVNSSYNVGIGGAASSSFKLQVTGTTNLTGALTGTSGVFSSSLTATAFIPTSSTIPTNGLYLPAANTLGFATNSTLDMVITATGNVGIGTSTTPDGRLELRTVADEDHGLKVTYAAASNGRAIWINQPNGGGGGGATQALIYANNSGNNPYVTFDSIFTIQKSGNVGIGRTDPSFILDVNDTNASGARGLRISTSSSAAGPGLFLYINSGSQTNWLVGNSYEVGNVLEFRSSNSFGGNPGTAGTSRMLITNTGNVTIATARTSGANANSITLSDNVTGVQTPNFGVRILATSNNGSARSALAFEQDGGTNNDTAIAFYTQFSAASLDRRMTINRNGNILVGSATTDYGYRLAVASGTQHLGAGFVFSNDITATTRQCATAFADFSGTSPTFDLASLFPRVAFTNRGLSVTMQLVALPTYTIVSSAFVVLGRTGNSNQWASDIQTNINISGAVINSVSASGTVITVNYNTFIFGTAYISIATVG